MKKKLLVFAAVMAFAVSAAACGGSRDAGAGASSAAAQAAETQAAETEAPAESESAAESQTQAEEDGQNPVMNFVGVYSNEYSTEALVEADGKENARITVTCADSPWFHHQTVMSGRLDTDTLTVEFTDAKKTEYTYKSDGSVDTETVSYTDGTGRAVFSLEDNTLTITEHFPSGDSGTVYVWGTSPDMKTVSDPDHYNGVTAMDKAKIETVVAFQVRRDFLAENWIALSEMMEFPVLVNGTAFEDSDAFLGYMMDKTVDESDRQAMMEESTLDMMANGQGICMGSGQVWLNDPNYMTDREPELKIIAVNGIVPKEQ